MQAWLFKNHDITVWKDYIEGNNSQNPQHSAHYRRKCMKNADHMSFDIWPICIIVCKLMFILIKTLVKNLIV